MLLFIRIEEVDFKFLGMILGFLELVTMVLVPEYPGVLEPPSAFNKLLVPPTVTVLSKYLKVEPLRLF